MVSPCVVAGGSGGNTVSQGEDVVQGSFHPRL